LSTVAQDLNVYLASEKSESFDAVVSAFTIHNLSPEERKKVCAEVFRILKPGGVFVNADKIASDDVTAHEATLARQIEQFSVFKLQGRPDLQDEWIAHYSEDERIKLTEKEWEKELQKSGFLQIKKNMRAGMEAVYTGRKG
jgi:ubiquinone/menaquinone biosynthesis C-methylase UbiE